MAHSGKTMTFATDLFPNEDNIYSLGDSDHKWKINGISMGNARVFYGTCSNAEATKIVSCPSYNALQDGDILFVNFSAINTGDVGDITLNVNNTGARNIKYLNNANDPGNIPAAGYIRAATYMFRYKQGATDATSYWIIDIQYNSNDNTLTRQQIDTSRTGKYSLLQSYYTIGTATSTTARTTYRSDNIYTEPSTGTIFATNFNGNGTDLTSLNGSNISSGTVAETYIDSSIARLNSPELTGTPTAPTAANGTSTTQIATTAFVNNTLAYINAMQFKGTLGTGGTITALPATHNAGDTYRVITAGTWAGKQCEIGTLIICVKDGTTAANGDWTSVETNEDGAIIGSTPSSSTDNAIVRWDGNTGRIIQDSKVTINDDGYITLTHIENKSRGLSIQYGSTIDYWWGVGNGNENHGLYDVKANKWILSAGTNNSWSFTGNADTATTATNLSVAPTITAAGTATVNLTANTAYTLTVGGKSVIFKTPADSDTNTLMNYTLGATTRAYLMGSQNAPATSTVARAAHGDLGVYLTNVAGQLSAKSLSINDGVASAASVEKVWMQWNATDKALEFVFA